MSFSNYYFYLEDVVCVNYVTKYVCTCRNCKCIDTRIVLCSCLVVRLNNDFTSKIVKTNLSVIVATFYPPYSYCSFTCSSKYDTILDSTGIFFSTKLGLTAKVHSVFAIIVIRECLLLTGISSVLVAKVTIKYTCNYFNFTINESVLCNTVKITCVEKVCTNTHSAYFTVVNYFSTNRASSYCRTLGFCSGMCCHIYHCVSSLFNFLLSNDNFAANFAVLTFCKTCCCTCCINCSINYFFVTKSFALSFATFTLLGLCASCIRPRMLVRRNVVRIFFATFALTVYEVVFVRRNVVRIFFATFTLTVYEVVFVGRNVVRIIFATNITLTIYVVMVMRRQIVGVI